MPVLDISGKETGDARRVLYGGDARYVLGRFNGRRFTRDRMEKQRYVYGSGGYFASQVWRGGPKDRIIQMGWIKTSMTGMHVRMGFSLQSQFTLRETDEGLRVFSYPVEELDVLRREKALKSRTTVPPGQSFALPVGSELFDVVAVIDGDGIDVQAGNYNAPCRQGKIHDMPAAAPDGKIHFRLLVDRPVVEAFWGQGRSQYIQFREPGRAVRALNITNTGEKPMTLERIELYEMNSIWPKPSRAVNGRSSRGCRKMDKNFRNKVLHGRQVWLSIGKNENLKV